MARFIGRERELAALAELWEILDDLRARAQALAAPDGWHTHYALFSRSGFTASLQVRAARERVILADLEQVASA